MIANKQVRHFVGKKIVFHVDHSTLLYLAVKKALHDKLARWMLILTKFKFTIIHTLG